jgi:hypothetical protein
LLQQVGEAELLVGSLRRTGPTAPNVPLLCYFSLPGDPRGSGCLAG